MQARQGATKGAPGGLKRIDPHLCDLWAFRAGGGLRSWFFDLQPGPVTITGLGSGCRTLCTFYTLYTFYTGRVGDFIAP